MAVRSVTTAAVCAAVVLLQPMVSAGDAAAQDVAAGRRKAIACQGCHGMDGLAKMPDAPNLAAQPANYLERELRAYRSGARRSEVMSVAAKALSDADIRDVAAYYAAIRIEIKDVPQ
jgi:cytochrome c553